MQRFKLLILLAGFGFGFGFSGGLFAAPSWFGKLQHEAYEKIGYGEGASFEQARANAEANIASEIRTFVASEFTSSTKLQGDELEENVSKQVTSRAQMMLSGTKLVRQAQEKQRFFVAISFDTRPFETKFFAEIGNKRCTTRPGFLNYTPVGENLRKLAGCDLELKLYYQSGILFVESSGVSMAWPEETIDRLLPIKTNLALNLSATNNSLRSGDRFSLLLTPQKVGGFVSFFNVYDSGQVALMVDNFKADFGQEIQIPESMEPNLMLEASTGGKPQVVDLYLVVWHEQRLNLSRFAIASSTSLLEHQGNNLPELIDLLAGKEWSSTLVTVER